MIKLIWAFLLTALCVCVYAAEPFVWSMENSGDKTFVTLQVAPECYVYQEHTAVSVSGGVEVSAPETVMHYDPLFETEMPIYETGMHRWEFKTPAGNAPVIANISYQGCRAAGEDGAAMCFPPKKLTLPENAANITAENPVVSSGASLPQFTVVAASSGLMDATEMSAFLNRNPEKSLFDNRGFWGILLLTLLGGLALNLTPCVLPLIPVNLAIIGAGQRAENRLSGLINGSFYAAGMALTYGILGLLAALAGARFGALNTSAWFNFAVAAIFVYLALAMFGVFNLDFSNWGGRRKVDSSSWLGKILVLFLGMVAALLAGACVAPVVVSVLLLAAQGYAAGNTYAVLWPFVLGLGMALPWPLAGAGLGVMPKPGEWMKYVKWTFGTLIVLMALYYTYSGWQLLPVRGSAENYSTASEVAKLQQALNTAEAQDKQVFIDVWSTTCKNCLYMEETTFKDAAVLKDLQKYIVVKYQIEDFEAPANVELLNKLNAPGLPAVGIITP